MDNQQFIWIAAIGTAVASGWRYILALWNSISSLVVLKVEVKDMLAYEILGYLWDSTHPQPLNPRKFDCWYMFVKTVRRNQMVAFETIGSSGIIFWKGWRPIWVTTASGGSDKDKNDRPEPDENITIRYLRGTLNIDRVIEDLCLEHNKSNAESDDINRKRCRFQVVRRIGSRGRAANGDSIPGAVISESGNQETGNIRTNRRRRPIGYQWDSLGESPDEFDNSPFDFLAYPDEVMDVVRRLEHWMQQREWYADRRIPWRRGVLLSGPPGSGKSSMIRAVGEYIGLPINVFDMASMTNEDFLRAWADSLKNSPCIIAIEDIDAIFAGRENKTSNSGNTMALSFDCLLNCISGVVRSDGVLLFVTTNHSESLDPAIRRSGRIDEEVILDGIDYECRRKVAEVVLREHDNHVIEGVVREGELDQPADFHNRCSRLAEHLMWNSEPTNGELINGRRM